MAIEKCELGAVEASSLLGEVWVRVLDDVEGVVDKILWIEGEVIVAEVRAELSAEELRELVVKRGLLSPSPLTSPLWLKELKEAGRFGGRVKPPRLRGL